MAKRNLLLLGASGSIGTQTLKVIDHYDNDFNLIGVSVYNNISFLKELLKKYNSIKYVYLRKLDEELIKQYPNITFYNTTEGIIDMVSKKDVDVVLNGIVGFSGVIPTYYALLNNKEVCLANKESLVCAGDLINDLLNKGKGKLYPVDSEHCAITQCLVGEQHKKISNLIITASGGPFRNKSIDELKNVTVEQALNHPTWKMGKKITIDSSTLINKALEVIEAHYLFNVDGDHIRVLIHPTSIVHSMVEFSDGTIKAQLGCPSMTLPIQYALLRNNHGECYKEEFDYSKPFSLDFIPLDLNRFESVKLAYICLEEKHGLPIVLNGSNEVAVNAFLEGKIKYLDILEVIKYCFDNFTKQEINNINDVIKVDAISRKLANDYINMKGKR